MPDTRSTVHWRRFSPILVLAVLVGVKAMEGRSDNLKAPLETKDSYSWLEDRTGERALTWVHAQNERTLSSITQDPRYGRYYQSAFEVSRARGATPGFGLSFIELINDEIYNIWYDDAHPHGLWRRTSLDSFRSLKPQWEPVLDVEALAKAEGQNWNLTSVQCLRGTPRCLIRFTTKWWGYAAWREFDLDKRDFVPGGFALPETLYNSVVWKDLNTLWVAADFGPGTTRTDTSPLFVKEWTRGQPLSTAKPIFKARPAEDDLVFVDEIRDEAGTQLTYVRALSVRNKAGSTHWQLTANGSLKRMTLPLETILNAGIYRGQLILVIKEDWSINGKLWKAGSVISVPVTEVTSAAPDVQLLMEPSGPREIFTHAYATRDGVLVFGAQNVRDRVWLLTQQADQWKRELVPLPDNGTISIALSPDPADKKAFVVYESLVHAPSLYEIDVAENHARYLDGPEMEFDTSNYLAEQLEATSSDGTSVPYFVARPKNLRFDGRAPTILMGYGWSGGLTQSTYDGNVGKLWLEHGGVYVKANIRGGAEFGPAWHVTGAQRQHTYDDFKAVSEDLIKRKLTSPAHLGLFGYSAGGTLVGVMLTKYPDLFNAAMLMCPVLDNFRLDLGTGGPAVQQSEYGYFDNPEDRAFLDRTSPFQNLRPGSISLTPLIFGNTTDQNVFPGQPRRFAAKMQSLGLPFYYYEASAGGHSIGETPEQVAQGTALTYLYFTQRLMDAQKAPNSASVLNPRRETDR